MLLSKSDFKVARTCPSKLYYRKLKYPTATDDNPYLEFLADGGYMVEAVARLMFPEGFEIVADSLEERVSATMGALTQENVTLFGATLRHDQLIAEIDILAKSGDQIRLIEVKSKIVKPPPDGSSPFKGPRVPVLGKWKPLLEDIAFQTLIVRNLFPRVEVIPELCLVDKTKTSTVETDFTNFQITPRPKDSEDRFQKPEITFTGDIEAMRNQSFVRMFDVKSEVEALLPIVKKEAAKFVATLNGDKPTRIEPILGTRCKNCEYRLAVPEHSGFKDCWGKLAEPSPHLLDLGGGLRKQTLDDMIAQGKAALVDISPDVLHGRQAMQLKWTKANKEFIDPKLAKTLEGCQYPLQFVDFEATRVAVPYHAGMHPYGLVAFQWSCHTVPEPGAEWKHDEWINIENDYPNFEFALRLKDVISEDGTVFVWTSYERKVLENIRDSMSWYEGEDSSLADWLNWITDKKSPLLDLHDLARRYYFHPDMGGSVSIKKVLPAIWFNDPKLQRHRWFQQYRKEENGRVVDPYKALPPLAFQNENGEDDDAVREGTAAVRTYQDMMYGKHRKDPAYRNTMKQRLLNYCRLDTAAMAMIWMHWIRNTQVPKLLKG